MGNIAGIDLGLAIKKETTAVLILDSNGKITDNILCSSLNDAVSLIKKHKCTSVYVDAPLVLKFNNDEGIYENRLSESLLMRRGSKYSKNKSFSPMSANMLTLLGIRAIKLKERLINEAGLDSNDIFEVHPLTTSEYLALEHHKTSFDNFTRGFYELSGLDASGLKNVHLLDALLCAYTGYLDLKGQCIKVGDENEGAILVPVPKDIKCIFFDMDGTLTDIKSPWQMVFETLGIWEREGAGLLAGWLRGEYDYCEFCKKDTDAWSAKGLTEEMFLKILGNINIYKEAWEVLQYLSGKGIKCIIISTGFYKTAEEIAKRCNMGFEKGLNNFSADVLSVFANDIVFKDNQINALTDVNADNGKQGSKGNILKSCLKKLKTGNIRCLSAGDSRQSDKELFDLTADFVFIEKASDLKKIIGKIEG